MVCQTGVSQLFSFLDGHIDLYTMARVMTVLIARSVVLVGMAHMWVSLFKLSLVHNPTCELEPSRSHSAGTCLQGAVTTTLMISSAFCWKKIKPKDQPSTQYDMDTETAAYDHSKVLELCVTYVYSAATLLRIGLVSRQHDALVVAHVQQQLCSLLEPTINITMGYILEWAIGSTQDIGYAAQIPWGGC